MYFFSSVLTHPLIQIHAGTVVQILTTQKSSPLQNYPAAENTKVFLL